MLVDLFGETGATVVQWILALVLVVALIFMVAWVLRRFGGGRFGAHGTQAELGIVASLAIDQKRRLVLVRHGELEHLLLVGGGSDAVVERSMRDGIPLAAVAQGLYDHPLETLDLPDQSAALAEPNRAVRADSSATQASIPDVGMGPASSSAKSMAAAAAAGVGSLVGSLAIARPARQTADQPAQSSGKVVAEPPPTVKKAAAQPASRAVEDEREALSRSLDKALHDSLFDEADDAGTQGPAVQDPDARSYAVPAASSEAASVENRPIAPDSARAGSLTSAPAIKETVAPAAPKAAAPVKVDPLAYPPQPLDSTKDDQLERELEAALDLDGFGTAEDGPARPEPLREAAGRVATSAQALSSPLPDLSQLTDDTPQSGNDTPAAETMARPVPTRTATSQQPTSAQQAIAQTTNAAQAIAPSPVPSSSGGTVTASSPPPQQTAAPPQPKALAPVREPAAGDHSEDTSAEKATGAGMASSESAAEQASQTAEANKVTTAPMGAAASLPPGPDLEPTRKGDPIPVTIPSRGPAANARTVHQGDQPTSPPASQQPPRAAPDDDLDEEMRRLLGELADQNSNR